jgi:DNA polymerase-3 subunit alpha
MARQEHGRALHLRMNGGSDAVRLKALLDPFRVQPSGLALDGVFTADDIEAAPLPRGCPVEIEYHNHAARCAVRLGDAWRIRPDEALLVELRRWLSDAGVELRYA